jgi:hypothetical protein
LTLSAPLQNDRHFVQLVASEFEAAAAHCPLFFTKDEDSGKFLVGAAFGFEPGEDLVSAAPGAGDSFVPLDRQRQGFFVIGEDIGLDVTHPRFGNPEGERLFDDSGGASEALRRVQRVLGLLISGTAETEAFVAAMLEHRLIEPLDISLKFDDGRRLQLAGLYTVSRDRLAELDDGSVLQLFRSGHLQLATTMSVSLGQVAALASRKNALLAHSLRAAR